MIEELSNIGLHLNTTKTKVLTTSGENADFLDVGGNLTDIITGTARHKYLGRYLPGDLQNRGEAECQHRFQAAWFNFHKHQKVLLNRHVPIKRMSPIEYNLGSKRARRESTTGWIVHQ